MNASTFRKVKYRLRRCFCPRKHLREVKDIRINQMLLMRVNAGIEHYDHLMCGGILGDALWNQYHDLMHAKIYYEREISKLKEKVRMNYNCQ